MIIISIDFISIWTISDDEVMRKSYTFNTSILDRSNVTCMGVCVDCVAFKKLRVVQKTYCLCVFFSKLRDMVFVLERRYSDGIPFHV